LQVSVACYLIEYKNYLIFLSLFSKNEYFIKIEQQAHMIVVYKSKLKLRECDEK